MSITGKLDVVRDELNDCKKDYKDKEWVAAITTIRHAIEVLKEIEEEILDSADLRR